jgi:ATP-dependent helicase/nuclease subunit B
MTKSILEGNINIDPFKKSDGTTPCKYCEYIGICQFDKSLGNSFRLIGKMDKDDIIKPAKGGGGSNGLD